jgi:hypothetical protein
MITKDAELIFLKTAQELQHKQPTHRCLFLRFSQLDCEKEKWLPYVMHALKEFSYNGATDAYLCHDDDLFILGRSWSYKRLQEFLSSRQLRSPWSWRPYLKLGSIGRVFAHYAQKKSRTLNFSNSKAPLQKNC